MNIVHIKLGWLKVHHDRALASLLFSMWKIVKINQSPMFLFLQLNTNVDSDGCATRQAAEGCFLFHRAKKTISSNASLPTEL